MLKLMALCGQNLLLCLQPRRRRGPMKPHGLPVTPGPAANVVAVVEPAEPGLPAIERAGFGPSDDCGRGDARFESCIAEPQPISGWFLSRISWLDEFP